MDTWTIDIGLAYWHVYKVFKTGLLLKELVTHEHKDSK